MKADLANSECPMDANLECVLPGVHERLASVHRDVGLVKSGLTGIQGDMHKMQQSLVDVPGSVANLLKQSLVAHREHQAACLRDLADHMVARTADQMEVSLAISPSQEPTSPPEPLGAYIDDIGQFAHVSPAIRHHSLRSLMDEWYGEGDYKDLPVMGGFASLEHNYKSKWRMHFSPSQKRQFNRQQHIVNGFLKASEDTSQDLEEIVNGYEVEWSGTIKKSPANMVKRLQGDGFVIRRPKNQNRQNEMEVSD